MKLADLVDADLTPLKLLLDAVPPLLRQQAAAALARKDEQLGAAWLQALSLELESIVLQLNAAVDGFLLLLATRLKDKNLTAAYTKKDRSVWLADLENALHFKGQELKGWDEVEATRKDSNLVKHRLGIEFAAGTDTPLTVNHVVDLTEATVVDRFLGVRQWLCEVANKCRTLE